MVLRWPLRPGRDKTWVGQWDHGSTSRCGAADGARTLHPTCRFSQLQYAIHAWFDSHLNDMDVDTGPAVEAFLTGERAMDITDVVDPETVGSKVVTADAWSRPTTRLGLFPDASDGSLKLAPPTEAGSQSFDGGVQAGLLGTGENLVFRSEPVAEDTVLLGLPSMNLRAAVTSPQQVTHLTASLYRVDAEGGRELANVCAIQPSLRFGVKTLAPVMPGQAMTCRCSASPPRTWCRPSCTTTCRCARRPATAARAVLRPRLPRRPARRRHRCPARCWCRWAPPASGSTASPPPASSSPTVEGADDARFDVRATTATPADVDLYLQRQNEDGSWGHDLATGASSDLDGESLSAGRLPAGTYRVLVVNWAGAATQVEVAGTFFDSSGVAGGARPRTSRPTAWRCARS